jgi:electron transfer flavoprotein alpha subunit
MANTGSLIIAEVNDGKLAGVSREAVAMGVGLSKELGGEVSAVVIGTGTQAAASELVAAGAQKVYTVENADLASYQPDGYVQVVVAVAEKVQPKLILTGQTDTGRDLAPKVAFKLGASLTMDTVEIGVEGDKLTATKPVYGGNARATFESTADAHMMTIRVKAFEALESDQGRSGVIEPFDFSLDQATMKVKVIEVKKQESEGVRLEDAAIVVSGGRGLGGPEPFDQLEELAKVLGGAVGASRAVCDAGWVPTTLQIGLTGKTVTPDLYITVGVSGASQHMAGCSGAKNIVSINKDKDCNMFKESRFGVAGVWEEVLPAFIEMCRELRGS